MEKQENLSEDRMEEQTEETAQKKTNYRLVLTILMSIFVVFVICWGAYHMIQDMDQQVVASQETKEKTKQNKKSTGKNLDIDALVQELLEKVSFETELKKLDDTVAEGMIAAEPGTKLQIYMGNGSFADEVVVMAAENEEDAKKNQENAKTHLEEMQAMFQDYIPEEVKKIEDAVRVRCGCYVIVCVTSDIDTAEKIINAEINQ